MASPEEGDGEYREEGKCSRAVLPPPVGAARIEGEEISEHNRSKDLEDGAGGSMEDPRSDGVRFWSGTVLRQDNIIQKASGSVSRNKNDSDTTGSEVLAMEASFPKGNGLCTSLQDLMIGFTTGAIRFADNQDGDLVQAECRLKESCYVEEAKVQSYNSYSKVGVTASGFQQDSGVPVNFDASDGPSCDSDHESIKQGTSCLGSDADNEETDSENMDRRWNYTASESENVENNNEKLNQIDNCAVRRNDLEESRVSFEIEEHLDDVDWDKFFSTGQLRNKDVNKEANEPTVMAHGFPATKETENKDGWKKRRRVKDGANRSAFRMPRGMGAVETAMRKYCEKREGNIFEPRAGLEFDSEAEAFQFYNLYSWEVGFGIRKGNVDGNKDGYLTVRDMVCQRQGYDKRTKSKTKRCYCKAMIRLHRTEDDGWFISSFVKEHNHVLSATDEEKKEWNSHREIDQNTRDMIKNLRECNIKLSKVHCIMGSMYGSMNNIPFTRRSLKTICAQIAREQRDDDIKKTLELFRQMRSEDPGFQFSVDLDEKDQIKTLLWASGRSRSNYCCFGDVVTFDTTYCTNLYKMPFGLFVGVNNHFQSTIFGGVLMRDETAESFQWVFKEFLTLMGGVHPQTILTDQCKAMEIALKVVMAGTTHLWCRWHVFRDARIELGPVFRNNCAFKDEFHRVITEMLTIDEFNNQWNGLLEKYNLQTHHFMVKAFEKREKWAKCYNRGTFCARMTSTQRSESANQMLKTVVPRNSSMNRFVSNLNKLLYQRYAEEERAEHETKQELRVNKIFWDVEKHALNIYTRKVFEMFSQEMDKTRSYGVPYTEDDIVYTVKHTNAEYVQRYRRAEFIVVSVNKGERYECECGLYEHFGLLCCHVLRVFIHIGVSEIPSAHIMQRWTRRARDVVADNLRVKFASSNEHYAKLYLQTQIYGKAMEVARKGNFNYDTCDIVMKYLQKAERKVDEFMQKLLEEPGEGNKGQDNDRDGDYQNYGSSDTESVSANKFGASGSCAGMSDEEIMNIKAPPRQVKKGKPKGKRFLSFLDKIDKKNRSKIHKKNTGPKATGSKKSPRKKKNMSATSTKITPHCKICKKPGHNKKKCPQAMLFPEEE